MRLAVPDPQNWASQEEIDSVQVAPVTEDAEVFPNPFHPAANRPLHFRFPAGAGDDETVELAIFSASMDQIVTLEKQPGTISCANCLDWDGHDAQGRIVRSGIYVYVITVGGRQYTGKFAVITE